MHLGLSPFFPIFPLSLSPLFLSPLLAHFPSPSHSLAISLMHALSPLPICTSSSSVYFHTLFILEFSFSVQIDALPEVVKAVQSRLDVFLDGGVRQGTDVLEVLLFCIRTHVARSSGTGMGR